MLRRLATLSLLALTLALPSALPSAAALAQDGAPNAMDVVDAQGFRSVDGAGDSGTIPGGRLMLAAYLALYGLLAFYSVHLARKHKQVQGELAALRRAVEDLDDRIDEATASRQQ